MKSSKSSAGMGMGGRGQRQHRRAPHFRPDWLHEGNGTADAALGRGGTVARRRRAVVPPPPHSTPSCSIPGRCSTTLVLYTLGRRRASPGGAPLPSSCTHSGGGARTFGDPAADPLLGPLVEDGRLRVVDARAIEVVGNHVVGLAAVVFAARVPLG